MLSKPDKAFGTVTVRDLRETLEMLMESLRFFVFLETDFGTLKLILFYFMCFFLEVYLESYLLILCRILCKYSMTPSNTTLSISLLDSET